MRCKYSYSVFDCLFIHNEYGPVGIRILGHFMSPEASPTPTECSTAELLAHTEKFLLVIYKFMFVTCLFRRYVACNIYFYLLFDCKSANGVITAFEFAFVVLLFPINYIRLNNYFVTTHAHNSLSRS